MKRGTADHPKVAHLCELLGKRRPEVIGYLELLWHFTARYCPQGDLGRFEDRWIEAALDWNGRRGRLIEALTESGWIDLDAVHRKVVHDWADHADESVKRALVRQQLQFVSSHRVTAKSSGISQDAVGKTSEPKSFGDRLPEPEPEPEPEPMPPPLSAPPDTEPPDLSPIAKRIHARHRSGRKGQIYSTERSLVMAVADSVDPLADATRIERNHEAWCFSDDWRREGGRYVPRLERWLAEYSRDDPPSSGISEPEPEMTPEQIAALQDQSREMIAEMKNILDDPGSSDDDRRFAERIVSQAGASL